MELLSKLGINWKLLIAQLVNFAILFYILKRFAYQPIIKILNERTKKIEKGLKDTEEAKRRLQEIAEQEREILNRARAEAQKIIVKAEEVGQENKENLVNQARLQAERIIAEAKAEIELEKAKMLREVKAEVAQLVISATEKVLGEKIDEKKDREIINKSLE